ncbi:hypothetical protein Ndes2437A_g03595 [Nannochloris sp. 'desiccata']
MSSPCKNPDFEYKLGNTIESPGRQALTMPLFAAGDSSQGAAPVLLAATGRPEEASLVIKTRRGTPLGRSQPPAKRMRVLAPKTTPAPAPAGQPELPPSRGYASADLDRVFSLTISHRTRGPRKPLANTAALLELLADLASPAVVTSQPRPREGTAKVNYMLQEGTEKVLTKEMIHSFTDEEVMRRFGLLYDVFKINVDAADAEQLADQQWLTAVSRFAEKCRATGRSMLTHPFEEVCSLVKEIIDDLRSAPKGFREPVFPAGASEARRWEADAGAAWSAGGFPGQYLGGGLSQDGVGKCSKLRAQRYLKGVLSARCHPSGTKGK